MELLDILASSRQRPVILEGLAKLEYRGYDSAGMAVFDGEKIQITQGCRKIEGTGRAGYMRKQYMPGTVGIGHIQDGQLMVHQVM